MDPIIKEKWVKALRSGEYRQARGSFIDRETGEHCCLAVLGAVISGNKEYPLYPDDETTGTTVLQRGGLVYMNDMGEASFEEIADWIEANL